MMLVQASSCRILYTSLPRQGTNASDVFLFGSHSAHVTCIATNGNIALSGCSEGRLRLWRMADGQLADTVVAEHAGVAVTAVECLGPLMAAAGTAAGSITLYDTASGRLLAVQRLLAGPGPVSCLAAWLDAELLSAAALAPPGPRVPDGGGVLPGPNVGAPWRGLGPAAAAGQQEYGGSASEATPAALLAAAGPSGWLKVYRASLPGPHSWDVLHSSSPGSLAGPVTAVAFSPAGDTLAVASPAAQVLGTDATAVAAAGGQPGAVSLYRVQGSTGSGACTAGQQLQLWHQWCLRSLPVGLAVLPSSGVQLMMGRQLRAMQVLHLLVTPEQGSSVALTASRPLEDSSTQQQQQQQQQHGDTFQASRRLNSSPVQQQHSPAAAASPERLGYSVMDALRVGLQQQQQQGTSLLEQNSP
ncbi:hypothetical protein COO60DRAFT_335392 [Scenedesmus sp. NREL 46B-D3]|nr:hypothetical protein COO60DRAFT_335392 [Scenedesmus sp. NREL 46B-D3]